MKFDKHTPKHAQVRESLRQQIATGALAPGMRLPTEAQLQKLLMASDTTVVRALNDLVREGLITRRRGSGTFVAEREHPPLVPGRHLKMGLCWLHSFGTEYIGDFSHLLSLGALDAWGVHGVEPEVEEDRAGTFTRGTWRQPERGVTVECLGCARGTYDRTPNMEVVRKAGYDGVITLGIIEENWLEELLALGIPAVIVDYPTQRLGKKADLVFADPQHGYRDAVDAFVAQGFTRIHFMGALVWDPRQRSADPTMASGMRFGRRVDPDTFLRESAYRQAMDAHGLQVPANWVHLETNAGLDAFAAKLAAMPDEDRPQALLCHDVSHAEQIVRLAAAHGLPLQAAGAGAMPRVGRALNINLDAHEMGRVAGELLLARILRPSRPYLNVGVKMVFAGAAGRPPVVSGGAAHTSIGKEGVR